jgi:hypothetical protein
MEPEERQVILDRGFDRAMETVLRAFLEEGFALNPVGAGDLHRRDGPGHARRYAMLDAAPPEVASRSSGASQAAASFTCRVTMFELTGSCTLVTVENPIVRYPVLATLLPRLSERIGHVWRSLLRPGTLNAA